MRTAALLFAALALGASAARPGPKAAACGDPLAAPGAPEGVKAVEVFATNATLSWRTGSDPCVQGFEYVAARTDGLGSGPEPARTALKCASSTPRGGPRTQVAVVTGLAPATEYTFSVAALGANITGADAALNFTTAPADVRYGTKARQHAAAAASGHAKHAPRAAKQGA